MADLYIVDFGGDDDDRARRAAERDAERNRLHNRYVGHLAAQDVIDMPTARRIVAALFDHHDAAGRQCHCSCHPRLSSQHGDGFDCPCTWDEIRQAEATKQWEEFWDSKEASELRVAA